MYLQAMPLPPGAYDASSQLKYVQMSMSISVHDSSQMEDSNDRSWRPQLILEVVHRGPGIGIITWRYMEKCFQREKHGKPVDTAAKSAKVNWRSWELCMSRSCLYPVLRCCDNDSPIRSSHLLLATDLLF